MPIVNPVAVLPVKGIPRFAIVFVIGKIDAAAAPVLLPKIDGIDSPTPPALVDVALVVAVVVAVTAIVDKTPFDIVCSLSQFTFTICWDSKYKRAAKNTPAITASIFIIRFIVKPIKKPTIPRNSQFH
jgi:hypothetical protein